MRQFIRISLLLGTLGSAALVALVALITGGYYYVEPSLPRAEELRDVRPRMQMEVYSRDGRLMELFGVEKREPVPLEEIPQLLVQAVLAAEDDQFFEHSGIDYLAIVKAAFNYVTRPGERVPGGSTITQQITRVTNLMSSEYSPVHKFKEWILAFRIEREFTKEEILELYLNTYEFGQRSFGVGAAARTYFGKELDELTLSEIAIIAGIPTGPSIMNPYNSPENAAVRRAYVLRRLVELGWITEDERTVALAEPIVSQHFGQQTSLEADFVAEMVRAEMIRRFGNAAYTDGLRITTTIDSRLQRAANASLRATLLDYDELHGYRGPIARVNVEELEILDAETGMPDPERLANVMSAYEDVLDLKTALVLDVSDILATLYLRGLGLTQIGFDSVAWARPYVTEQVVGDAPETLANVLAPGDIVWMQRVDDGGLRLAQLPDVQGAFVAVDPQDGAIVSLVGGFDYFLNNFNRATQTARQPGSSFKPFIYSAALEHGFTPATIINDAPIVEESSVLERTWKPENFSGLGHGETRLREALKESMNYAAIRTLKSVGLTNAIRHLRRFGFDSVATPRDETLALGSGGVSPLDLASAYSVFANGGYGIEPYFIQRIETTGGDVLYEANASARLVCRRTSLDVTATCPDETIAVADENDEQLISNVWELYPEFRRAPRVLSAQNRFLITDILHDVARSGSGARAYRELRRLDIAGKTGTTNGPVDAWFAGFNADVVGVAWVGFDDNREMSWREQGGVTAIPMWIGFMAEALGGQPEHTLPRPPGIVDVKINPESGLIASDSNPNAIWEKFKVDELPDREPDTPFTLAVSEQPEELAGADEPIF